MPIFSKIRRVRVIKVLAPTTDLRVIEMEVEADPKDLPTAMDPVPPKSQITILDWLSTKVWRVI